MNNFSFNEFRFQRSLIHGLAETRPQMPMDFHCSPNDQIRLSVSVLGTASRANL